MRIVILFLLTLFSLPVFSQKKKATKAKGAPPTTVEPYYPQKEYSPKAEKKKKKNSGLTYEAQNRYNDRMKEVKKAQLDRDRIQAKSQYSNPLYFGHKRPPKKRPPEKMKYCKVCQIRH